MHKGGGGPGSYILNFFENKNAKKPPHKKQFFHKQEPRLKEFSKKLQGPLPPPPDPL
jgi:hypothetical protein